MTPDPRPRSGRLAIGAAAVVIALVLGIQWSGDEDDPELAVAPVAASARADSPFGDGPAAPPAVISADSASPTKPALAANRWCPDHSAEVETSVGEYTRCDRQLAPDSSADPVDLSGERRQRCP